MVIKSETLLKKNSEGIRLITNIKKAINSLYILLLFVCLLASFEAYHLHKFVVWIFYPMGWRILTFGHNTRDRYGMPYEGVRKWAMVVKAVRVLRLKVCSKAKTWQFWLFLNPVRPVGELKFNFFLLNFIQDKMLKCKTEERKKKERRLGSPKIKQQFFLSW